MWHTYSQCTTCSGAAMSCRNGLPYVVYEPPFVTGHSCLVVYQLQGGWHTETCSCQAHNFVRSYWVLGYRNIFIRAIRNHLQCHITNSLPCSTSRGDRGMGGTETPILETALQPHRRTVSQIQNMMPLVCINTIQKTLQQYLYFSFQGAQKGSK